VPFIEPQQPPSDQAVIDDVIGKTADGWSLPLSQPSRYQYCGYHCC